MNQRKLAIILSMLEESQSPKYRLEQYSITPEIAAATLVTARKDIKGKVVYDLGCGAGRFAIGAALLGAKKVVGVDIDETVLEIARDNVDLVKEKTGVNVLPICEWLQEDVKRLEAKADTVVQFPPFSYDKIFFDKALQIAETVYSIHKDTESTRAKLFKACKDAGWKIKKEKKFRYVLPWQEEKKIGREVFLLVAKRIKL